MEVQSESTMAQNTLNENQMKVAELLVLGKPVKEIAVALELPETTVYSIRRLPKVQNFVLENQKLYIRDSVSLIASKMTELSQAVVDILLSSETLPRDRIAAFNALRNSAGQKTQLDVNVKAEQSLKDLLLGITDKDDENM